jgi:dihydroorotase-like cyclic amidohydrolase
MKPRNSLTESIFQILIFSALPLISYGCAFTGGTSAVGQGANATGGTSTVNVQASPKLEVRTQIALGDEVAKAAADAAMTYLTALPILPKNDQKNEAVRRGVDAGITMAKDQRQTVTMENRAELEKYVNGIVDRSVK